MLSWEQFTNYAAELRIKPEYVAQTKEFFEHLDPAVFDRIAGAERIDQEELRQFFPDNGYMRLLFILSVASLPEMQRVYREKGFSAQMMDDIRPDLDIWLDKFAADYGFPGLDMRIYGWTRSVRTGSIIQFGRLQCNYDHNFYGKVAFFRNADGSLRMEESETHNDEALFSFGDPAINLHIPAAGPLKRELCIDSLRRMTAFFEEKRPDFKFKAIVCYSWILDPAFTQIMANTNLAGFQSLGHIFRMEGVDQTNEVVWRVFNIPGGTPADRDRFPLDTGMRKAVAGYLEKGGTFCEHGIVILRDELPGLFK